MRNMVSPGQYSLLAINAAALMDMPAPARLSPAAVALSARPGTRTPLRARTLIDVGTVAASLIGIYYAWLGGTALLRAVGTFAVDMATGGPSQPWMVPGYLGGGGIFH